MRFTGRRERLQRAIVEWLTWIVCLGLSRPDARRVQDDVLAGDAEAEQRGSAFGDRLRGAWRHLRPKVTNLKRWKWRRVLNAITTGWVNALLGAVPVGGLLGLAVGMATGSTPAAVGTGLATGTAVVVFRAIRDVRRARRYEDDPAYRARMSRPEGRWATVANAITASRVCGGFVLLAVPGDAAVTAFATVAALVGSDIVDGYVARRWRHETRIGDGLDRAADRFTIACAAFAVIRHPQGLPALVAIIVVVMLVNNVLHLLGGLCFLLDGRDLPETTGIGQTASMVGMGALVALYAGRAWGGLDGGGVTIAITGGVVAAACLEVWSLWGYRQQLQRGDGPSRVTGWSAEQIDADPFTVLGVRACLAHNPLLATQANLFDELVRESDADDDILDPLELVQHAIKRHRDALSRRPRTAEAAIERLGLEERLQNLRVLEQAIEDFQR